MNDLGKRLNDLASRATTGVVLADPSITGPATVRSVRGRKVTFGLVSALAVASMLFLWQGRNSGTTSVVVGQGEDNSTGFFTGGPCTDGPVLELLQAGIPTYDYEPAGSFDELANQSAAVVVGQVASMARTEVNGRSYIEVTVSDVFEISVDSGADTPRNDIEIIAYQAQWADRSAPDPLASPVAVDGLDFFGFLSPWSGVRGGWAPGPCRGRRPGRAWSDGRSRRTARSASGCGRRASCGPFFFGRRGGAGLCFSLFFGRWLSGL